MRGFGISQAMGRRAVPRTQSPVLAVLSLSAGDYEAAIIDISRTGARLCGDVLPSVGQRVNFRAETVQMAADVVWCDLGTCALEFETPIAICEVQRLRWLGRETALDS